MTRETSASPWLLEEVRHPSEARILQRKSGIDPIAFDQALWCHEIHMQLMETAKLLNIELVLIGGHGASMRLAAETQRASADNDYIVAISEDTAVQLVTMTINRLASSGDMSTPGPLRRLHGPPAGPHLPMVSFALSLPPIASKGSAHLTVKVEFHLEHVLPPTDAEIEASLWTSSTPIRARLPRVPFQIAMKLMTLAAEPIGLPPARIDALPRQVYDIDGLLLLTPTADAGSTRVAVIERLRVEAESKRLTSPPMLDEVVASILERARTGFQGEFRSVIDRFQFSQLTGASRRTPADWSARFARLAIATQLLVIDDDAKAWQSLLEEESLAVGGSALLPRNRGRANAFWNETAAKILGKDWR